MTLDTCDPDSPLQLRTMVGSLLHRIDSNVNPSGVGYGVV